MLIQDCRPRAANIPAFKDRSKLQRDQIVASMNDSMASLVGANNEIESFHERLADIAIEMHQKTHAYTGDFESIWARTGAKSDTKLHALDDSELPPADLSSTYLLITT